jgi:hypothetical protein
MPHEGSERRPESLRRIRRLQPRYPECVDLHDGMSSIAYGNRRRSLWRNSTLKSSVRALDGAGSSEKTQSRLYGFGYDFEHP